MREKTLSPEQKWIIIGIPILFLIGSMLHFLYDFTGGNAIICLIAPVNESVWEHLKMILVPIILWWGIYYIFKGKQNNIDKDKWFTSALIAVITAMITMLFLFYFYTGAFGVEILAVDIAILFISILAGQLMALHFYNYSKGINSKIALAILILIIVIFAIFTFNPPQLPIFQDSLTGQYGIG